MRAVIVQFLPGQEAGHALASVLFGAVNPSAKLPLSFPADDAQTWLTAGGASAYPGLKQPGAAEPRYVTVYSDGLQMGYRWFDAVGEAPLFAFGFGLSYTSFQLTDLKAEAGEVAATITNTGTRHGGAVAQLYLGFPEVAAEPPQQLKGFSKQLLAPGQSARVRFALTRRDLSVWDVATHAWAVVAGTFRVHVGLSSRDPDALVGSFDVRDEYDLG